MTDRPIRLVLDTSAITAYAGGSEHVGETLSEVHADGVAFTVPVSCLATAGQHIDAMWPELLIRHPAFETHLTVLGRWRALSANLRLLGRVDTAEALLAALDHDCNVLTAKPGLYAALGDDPPIITVE